MVDGAALRWCWQNFWYKVPIENTIEPREVQSNELSERWNAVTKILADLVPVCQLIILGAMQGKLAPRTSL